MDRPDFLILSIIAVITVVICVVTTNHSGILRREHMTDRDDRRNGVDYLVGARHRIRHRRRRRSVGLDLTDLGAT